MTFSAGPYRSSLPTGAIGDLPVAYPRTGKTFWVNNSTVLPDSGIAGSDSNPGTYLKPFSTLDYAVGRCTAGRGDVIYIIAYAESNPDKFAEAEITIDGEMIQNLNYKNFIDLTSDN